MSAKKLLSILLVFTLLCTMALPAALAEDEAAPEKNETVYVLCAPDGSTRRVIVTGHLTNPQAAETLPDVSSLTDIESVKGYETFDGTQWQADGQDIYYRGDSNDELPVDVRISYTLDGEAVTPEELAGKSGRVTIRFDFTVTASRTVTIDGQKETVTLPFAVLSAVLMENDVFRNVTVVNGRVINDGDRMLVVGAALPGMAKSLKLAEDTDVTLPEYVEITADAEYFALPLSLICATCKPFARLDTEKLNSAADLQDAADQLTDGMTRLMSGSGALVDGLSELNEKSGALISGVDTLADGLTTLTGYNDSLNQGASQVFSSLLSVANSQLLAAGLDVPELTMENYAQTLDSLIASTDVEAVARQQVEQAVRAQEGTVRAAVTEAVRQEVAQQVTQAAEAQVTEKVLAALNMTSETYQAAVEAGQVTDTQKKQIEAAVKQQMASDEVKALIDGQTTSQMASDDVTTLISAKTEEQVQALIAQNVASDEVQKQIAAKKDQADAARQSLTVLKTQLDNYQTFYTGLTTYTQGVASASEGAAALRDNLPALSDGIAQLLSGAETLRDGLATFNSDGVEQLTGLTGDIDTLLARVRALADAAKDYAAFSGLADGVQGSVSFIWRTDAIR